MSEYRLKFVKALVDGPKTWSQLLERKIPRASLSRLRKSLIKEKHVRQIGKVYALVSVPKNLVKKVLEGYGPFKCPVCGKDLISLAGIEIEGGDLVGCPSKCGIFLIRCPLCGYPMKVAKTHTLEIKRPFPFLKEVTLSLSHDVLDALVCSLDRFKWRPHKGDKWPKAFEVKIDRKKSPVDPQPRPIKGLDRNFFFFIHSLQKREGKTIISQRLKTILLFKMTIEIPTPFDSPEFQNFVSHYMKEAKEKIDSLSARMHLTMFSGLLAEMKLKTELSNPYSEKGQKIIAMLNRLFLTKQLYPEFLTEAFRRVEEEIRWSVRVLERER